MTKDLGMVENRQFLFGIWSDILSGSLSDILSDILSGSLSGILPGILCDMAYLLLQALVAARWSQRSKGRFGTDLVQIWWCWDTKEFFLGNQLVKRGNAALGSKRDHAFST